MFFRFNIVAWQACSGRMSEQNEWENWAKQPEIYAQLPDTPPNLAFLSPMQRRRLSTSARLMCQASWDLANQFPDSPLVYASRDGEMNRSFDLWLELLKNQTVSPTSFGLSVHNALAGQFSILRGQMRESTALAVAEDGLEMALLEAYTYLQEGEPSVLVVWADEPLLAQYDLPNVQRAPFAYALAMVVTAGNQFEIKLLESQESQESQKSQQFHQAISQKTQEIKDYWGALDWIRFMLSDDIQQKRHYPKRCYAWQKNVE